MNMDFTNLNLEKYQKLARIIILEAAKVNFKRRSDFQVLRNRIVKEYKGEIFHNLYFIKAYQDLLREGKIKPNNSLLNLLRKRGVRTLSGVAPVTVLTKPYKCPGKCIYCPTDVRMPKSYVPSQPAAQRAYRQKFNPYTQVVVRLKALLLTGHEVSKVELRVIGGTFSYYPKNYQKWFLKRCLKALNEFYGKKSKSLSFEKIVKDNETAEVRCIGINIETRPDYIDENEVKRLRSLGVTKVEMGVQTISDEVNKICCRGHGISEVKKATKLLKDAGFKIGYHMMPNLPGSTVELDKKMIGELFKDESYQPDYLKIYPCVVMPQAKLAYLYRKGEYKPYTEKQLEEVLFYELKSIPEWCRVDRVARDIPAPDILGGFKLSNIRQILDERFKKEKIVLRDIRSREIKGDNFDSKDVKLVVRKYKASGREEVFLSYEDTKNDKLIALLRLRLTQGQFIKEIKNSALIREVHVYGRQISVGEKGDVQHMGFGGKLMKEAESIAKKDSFKKISVIAGIGTREYYKKTGYKLEGTYMVKYL